MLVNSFTKLLRSSSFSFAKELIYSQPDYSMFQNQLRIQCQSVFDFLLIKNNVTGNT
jgi:hypothetical protein